MQLILTILYKEVKASPSVSVPWWHLK